MPAVHPLLRDTTQVNVNRVSDKMTRNMSAGCLTELVLPFKVIFRKYVENLSQDTQVKGK